MQVGLQALLALVCYVTLGNAGNSNSANLAAVNSQACSTVKSNWESDKNDANQCAKLNYEDVHYCTCAEDADCRFGGPDNAAWWNNFKCCTTAAENTATHFQSGRCIDITIESCCQFKYNTEDNEGYAAVQLSVAVAPVCCTWRNGNIAQAQRIGTTEMTTSTNGECQCSKDAHCGGSTPICCKDGNSVGYCRAEGFCCTDDTDCADKPNDGKTVCCNQDPQYSSTDIKRCAKPQSCCMFTTGTQNSNTVDDTHRWAFDSAVTMCCPYGHVTRVLDSNGQLSVTDSQYWKVSGFMLNRESNPTARCRCNPGGAATTGKVGRKDAAHTGSGCVSGETCCDVTAALVDSYWEISKTAHKIFNEQKCSPDAPNCLESCLGMCTTRCTTTCLNALVYEGAPAVSGYTGLTATYSASAPSNVNCCKYEVADTRLVTGVSSTTTTIQAKRFHVAYYQTNMAMTQGKTARAQVCCPIGGVQTLSKSDIVAGKPDCACYSNSHCSKPPGSSDTFECCGGSSTTMGKCFNKATHQCCKLDKTITKIDAHASSQCTCNADGDCPASVGNINWKCCGGKCYNSEIDQCCAGKFIKNWEVLCCETAAQQREVGLLSNTVVLSRSAGNRRDNGEQCRCDNDDDCKNIKGNGAQAPGTWRCCGNERGCGFCYETNDEQCCQDGPSSMVSNWGVYGKNGKTLTTRSRDYFFSDICCKVTGPNPLGGDRWERSLGTIKNSYPKRSLTSWDRGHAWADPLNACVCKTNADCNAVIPGATCCKITYDDPNHECNKELYFGESGDLTKPNSHCSGVCINPQYQTCCGNPGVNNAVICVNGVDRCCGQNTNEPTCCVGNCAADTPDDRFTFNEKKTRGSCASPQNRDEEGSEERSL